MIKEFLEPIINRLEKEIELVNEKKAELNKSLSENKTHREHSETIIIYNRLEEIGELLKKAQSNMSRFISFIETCKESKK